MMNINRFNEYPMIKAGEEGSNAAEVLLSRTASEGYMRECSTIIAKEKIPLHVEENSALVFRIENEWLALCTSVCKQVCRQKPIHSVPHMYGKILKGLVNIEGQIRMCIAMEKFLEIEAKGAQQYQNPLTHQRMIVMEKQGDLWVFPVAEVYGIYNFELEQATNLPVTLTKSLANYLKCLIVWNSFNVGLLDEELLFYSLKRKAL